MAGRTGVWLSEADNPRSACAVRAAEYADLGRLRSSSGEQIYRISADVALADTGSFVLWCSAFGVFFAAAPLSQVGHIRADRSACRV
ncbi:MAG: DM13 domain-containing protein [Alteraurantiacibacter sp.]